MGNFAAPETEMGRVLVIGDDYERVGVSHHQLVTTPRVATDPARRAPCEDLDIVLIDTVQGCNLDIALLRELASSGTTLIFTDEKHHPVGMLVGLYATNDTGHIRALQHEMSQPRKKRLWQTLVQAKVRHQAYVVDNPACRQRLLVLASQVRSGDSSNVEATAARLYWSQYVAGSFRRIPQTRDGLNGLLDYGYAVVRAALTRELVINGLDPSIPLHHSAERNRFALCDDLIEPLRPFVDLEARSEWLRPVNIQPQVKNMVGVLKAPAITSGGRGPLDEAISRYITSFKRCVIDRTQTIDIPRIVDAP